MPDMLNTLKLTYSRTLYVQECCACSITFAVPEDFDQRRRNDGKTFYCPAGHSQSYTKSELDRVREKLAREQAARERAQAREIHEHDQRIAAERSASAYKGRVTRLKNRAAAGVCPCCNRSFENLRRHMSTKHPDFTETADS